MDTKQYGVYDGDTMIGLLDLTDLQASSYREVGLTTLRGNKAIDLKAFRVYFEQQNQWVKQHWCPIQGDYMTKESLELWQKYIEKAYEE